MNWGKSIRPAVACLISVVACLLYAATRSYLPDWWRGHGGGIPYVIFWILLWLTLLPSRRLIVPICVGCVLMTCLLECFQLFEGPEWLREFRRTRFGAAWLGFGFDWKDIPPYIIGGVCGWVLGRCLVLDDVNSKKVDFNLSSTSDTL